MNLCLGLLVAAAVCAEIAQGLSCYTCGTETTSSECNEKTNCSALSPKLAFCKTTVMSPDTGFPFTGHEIVLRQCVQSCIPTGDNWLGVTKRIICCNLDFCNRNGIQDGSSSSTSISDECQKSTAQTAALNLITTTVLVFSAIIYSTH
ncbi:ly6/PLAUR domain-containing protein 2-like [Eleutherodactylus coqui]|uniref:ly6/PLAUR domain-containing protein 2-like n=1 Tax=Eleutherodactylus coqui TaxID=57060 RepID=UPI00346245C5